MTGRVRSLDPRGFGFIFGDDRVEYFFHASHNPAFNTLIVGQHVQFEVKRRQFKGLRAVNVQVRHEAAA
jgi:cold shock CspA family protein